jgi:hypothetical protein
MNALLVKDGQISRITLPDSDSGSSDAIRQHIGNWFTSCFTVNGVGANNIIMGYCDDEGLLTDTPDWNVIPDDTLRLDMQPIAGPIVIVGGDDSNGETRSLLDVEMEMFTLEPSPIGVRTADGIKTLPLLHFQRLS